MKKKIKQYSFWTGLAGAVVILVTALSNAFGFDFEQEIITDIIMAVCGVLVVFGVVNAPVKTEEENDQTIQIIDTITQDENENVTSEEKSEKKQGIKEKKENKK